MKFDPGWLDCIGLKETNTNSRPLRNPFPIAFEIWIFRRVFWDTVDAIFIGFLKQWKRGGWGYKWCQRWKRENSFFDARQSRVGPRSELMTRYNEPHARKHKDTPGWVRNHRKPTSHVHNCTRVRVWSKFATIVVVRARVQLFVSPLCHFGAWDRFNFSTIWLIAKHVIHSIGLNAPMMWDLF